jgi:hypothetical protein
METKTGMTYDDDLDIRCLLYGSEGLYCPHRGHLKKNFGWDIPKKCPIRVILKAMFEQHEADQKREQDKGEYESGG